MSGKVRHGDRRLTVVCVGAGPGERRILREALPGLVPAAEDAGPASGAAWRRDPRFRDVADRVRHYLEERVPRLRIDVEFADSLAAAPGLVADGRPVGVLLVFPPPGPPADGADQASADAVIEAVTSWPTSQRPELSPFGVRLYRDPSHGADAQVVAPFAVRDLPGSDWHLACDAVAAVADHVEARVAEVSIAAAELPAATLARGLADFLSARSGPLWGLHPYTGTVVSGIISDLERLAAERGNPVLRGPNEHGLACGALARWILDRAPFLIVVTSGMLDEFKGTLANLRDARARGFIVGAESPSGRWAPFQGTVHAHEDAREVMRAKRLKTFYLDRAKDLDRALRDAFAAYDADEGPVVLLVTHSVLEHRADPPPVPAEPAAVPADPVRAGAVVRESPFEQVVDLVNNAPVRLLWQVGAVEPEDRPPLLRAAHEAGAALADSLTRPGAVSTFVDGRPIPAHLGTLGLYGFTSRLYDYMIDPATWRLRPDLALFFLGSRIAEISTPFSESVLGRHPMVVQVTRRREHVAPAADLPLCVPVGEFLHRLGERLDVDPKVLAMRRHAIETVRDHGDPSAVLPTRPMTTGVFCHEVDAVVRGLVASHGYGYTGVYDVGRGGIAAIRNIARTGPGHSGWYGRALMGDALQALPAIALTRPGNVLAFVGDGAAALVPDITPTLVQQIRYENVPLTGNLSVFTLLNGAHSLIRTYQEVRNREPDFHQTTVVNHLEPEWTRDLGRARIHHRHLDRVDRRALAEQLLDRGTVNLYSVPLTHTSDGDGLYLPAERGWHAASPGNAARPGNAAARPPGREPK
ncbi:hypothetical protein [Actinomadura oligospora]|uniref:hypothetical protein n=1 Tax=Actinomadura oligospora TaxID=111804 RepID=UPI0012FB3B8E|nr:hypothetical protein [Actinomadura oligospora]